MSICSSAPRALLGACLLLAGITTGQAQFEDIQSRVKEFTLDNGLKFLVLPRGQAPVASFYTHADVGAVQEAAGLTGLAHMFEHMAFKGSSHLGTRDYTAEKVAMDRVDAAYAVLAKARLEGTASRDELAKLEDAFRAAEAEAGKYVVKNEFSQVVEQAGGRGLNAGTSSDYTVYFFSLPSHAAELWFYLESERFMDPVFREFYQERSVVMEERRLRTESSPVGKMIEEACAVAYKAHPYGLPVIGHMSDLQNLTRQDAYEFFHKYYVPSNMVSAIVGDVDPERMKSLAQLYLGRLKASPKPPPIHTVEPPQTGERRVTLKLASQPIVAMGYHKPSINHPDNAVYEAIGSILSEGRSSRLYRSLVRDKKIALQAGGFPGFPGQKYPNLFLFFGITAPGHSNAELEKGIQEEIDRLCTQLVSAEELDGVKRRALAGLIGQLDDNSGLAELLTSYESLTGNWRNVFKQVERIKAVTPQDVQRVARATFIESNRTVATIETEQKQTSQAQ